MLENVLHEPERDRTVPEQKNKSHLEAVQEKAIDQKLRL